MNNLIKKVVPQIQLNSLNLSLIKRIVDEDYEIHFHDLYEIEFITSGRAIQYINGIPVECGPNSIIFVTPLDMHSLTVLEPIELLNICFDNNCIDFDIRSLCNKNMYSHNISDIYINLLYDEFNTDRELNLVFQKHLLNCLLSQIARSSKNCPISNSNNISFEIARYIQQHYNESMDLNTLSTTFGYTKNYLSNQFHKSIGKTIKQFISDTRLEHAAKALLTTNHSVTDICYSSGFSSFSNFLRAFKNKFGTSPNCYRIQIKEK